MGKEVKFDRNSDKIIFALNTRTEYKHICYSRVNDIFYLYFCKKNQDHGIHKVLSNKELSKIIGNTKMKRM
jgi:bacteriocin-like protein